MKKIILLIWLCFLTTTIFAQIGANDANALIGVPMATDLAEINAILSPTVGSIVFNLDDEQIYRYTGATNGWQTATDDQTASEVNLDTAVDTDGDTITEATVEEVIQDIAPITSKAGRVFYPPSIAIDASSTTDPATPGDLTLNLYTQYTSQFSSPTAQNPGASGTIPVYAATELDYYVTYADPAVFSNIEITDAGVMTYDIIATPTDANTIINVVFVVK